LGSDSVSTIKLQDNAITNAKMADDAVGIAELSATGTPSSSTFLRGDNAWASADAGLTSVQVFTSSGTWTKPSGITKVIVEVQGAGGAGGADNSVANQMQNGSGGGYARKLIDVSSISTATITIGSGGASQSGGNGADGGNSIWSDGTNTVTGSGGLGARAIDYNTTSLGGAATGGDLNIPGSNGGGYNTTVGASFLSIAQPQRLADTTANKDGKGYGSGGAGSHQGVLNVASGSGADGIVIVMEYK
jgi:hypothetical protein